MKIQFGILAVFVAIALVSATALRQDATPAAQNRDLAVVPQTNLDWNGDGVVDWQDDVIASNARRNRRSRRRPVTRGGVDWNGDGVRDWRDRDIERNGWVQDSNRDGIVDYQDVVVSDLVERTRPVAVRADWNRDGVIDWQDEWRPVGDWNGDGVIDWQDDWVVRDGWRGGADWNRDGVIDWRDDVIASGPALGRYGGNWVRGDWNRDGVIDARDGWRRLDESWATGPWDTEFAEPGWRPREVSVREVPVGIDWDRDGIVDEWATTTSRPRSWRADWDGDGVWDSWGYGEAPTQRRVVDGGYKDTVSVNPGTTNTGTTTGNAGSATKPASSSSSTGTTTSSTGGSR